MSVTPSPTHRAVSEAKSESSSRAMSPTSTTPPHIKECLEFEHEYEDIEIPYFCKCKLRVIFFLSCSTASLLSLYTIYVKHNMEMMPNYYSPFCDISERISCTKVFRSKYGRGFGLLESIVGEESLLNIENGFIGLIYYSIIGLLSITSSTNIAKYLIYICAISNLASIYLAYLLYFVLDDLCIVCCAIYAINLFQLFIAYVRYHKCVEDDENRLNNEDFEKRLKSYSKSPESKKVD